MVDIYFLTILEARSPAELVSSAASPLGWWLATFSLFPHGLDSVPAHPWCPNLLLLQRTNQTGCGPTLKASFELNCPFKTPISK